jgi:spoIIIJ-associated protein
MERSVEMEARTLEEATTNALETLGASREDVEIKVLDDGKTGFLGFGSRLAKIRVTVKKGETQKEEQQESQSMAPNDTMREGKTEEALGKESAGGTEEEKEKIDVDMARHLLTDLMEQMKMEGIIESKVREGRIHMNIIGKDSGILIGKNGQTLDAIQYLLNLMYSKKTRSRARIVVDVEDYRIRREKKLQAIALEARNKVKRSNKPFATSPLSSQDRRIIHITLQDDDFVKTVSRGEGNLKKVIILPK